MTTNQGLYRHMCLLGLVHLDAQFCTNTLSLFQTSPRPGQKGFRLHSPHCPKNTVRWAPHRLHRAVWKVAPSRVPENMYSDDVGQYRRSQISTVSDKTPWSGAYLIYRRIVQYNSRTLSCDPGCTPPYTRKAETSDIKAGVGSSGTHDTWEEHEIGIHLWN